MSATGWWAEVLLVVRPNPAVIHLTGGSPTLLSGKRILASAAALTITGSAPTVGVTQHKLVQPSPAVLTIIGSRPVQGTSAKPVTAALTVTGGTPTIRLSDNKTVQPSPLALSVTTSAPEVTATANQFPTPTDAALTVSGGVPVVTATDHKQVQPAAASLTVTGETPSVGVGLTFVPSGLALSVTMAAPTIGLTAHKFVTPTNAALTVTGGQPVVRAPRLVTPTGAALTVTGGTPTVTVASTGAHYTDNFNRADSASLGTSWTVHPDAGVTLSISSNAARDTSGGSGNIYVSAMNTSNHKVTVVMSGATTGDQVVISLRINSSSATQYLFAQLENGSPWLIYRSVSPFDGSPATTAGNQSWANGDSISFEVQGTTAIVKLNGSTVVTASSVTVASGQYVGIEYNSVGTAHGFDSFDAQDI